MLLKLEVANHLAKGRSGVISWLQPKEVP